uniref:Uncharacterized protein n=1 Tax=Arundo donax TaxID=35708 RepID=A0A0A9CM33_ARUDO
MNANKRLTTTIVKIQSHRNHNKLIMNIFKIPQSMKVVKNEADSDMPPGETFTRVTMARLLLQSNF